MVWTPDQLFSMKRNDWATPWALFRKLDEEFNFALDAAASSYNTKCEDFLSSGSLEVSWFDRLVESKRDPKESAIWLNPPYGREIGKWIEKAYLESVKGCTVVCFVFVRSDTKWWHDWAMKASEIRFVPGRVRFEGAENSAPAPSCVLVFDEARRLPRFVTQVLPRR